MVREQDKSVVVAGNAGKPALPEGADVVRYDEGAELDRSVIGHPIYRLIQKDADAGKFKRLDTSEVTAKLRVVLLLSRRGRLKWPKGAFRTDAKPECWSMDGVRADPRPTRDGRIALRAGQACIGCPFYTSQVAGKRDEGLCHVQHNMIMLNMDTGEPFLFRLSGMLNLDGPAIMGPVKNPHVRRRVIVLEPLFVKNPSGDYYRIRVTVGNELTEEQKAQARALFESAQAWETLLDEESDLGGGESEPGGLGTRQQDEDFPF